MDLHCIILAGVSLAGTVMALRWRLAFVALNAAFATMNAWKYVTR